MNILLCNKFYYRRGGDCIYTLNLEKLLKAHGHKVAVFAMQYPENEYSEWSKYWPSEVSFKPGPKMINGLLRPFGTKEVKNRFNALLSDFKPDVVHLGNIHSQLSPIIAELAHQKGCKVVWTLHDYKLICPRYDFLKKGKDICVECLSNKKAVLQHKCMKNSFLASWLGYREAKKWNAARIEACTDHFICASPFVADMMKRGGFKETKLNVICHSIETEACSLAYYPTKEERNYYCFIGRLSHEKGAFTLLNAAERVESKSIDGTTITPKLVVIGGGPLENELRNKYKDNPYIEFAGFKQWDEIKDIVSKARFCVVPSEWYEVLGLVNLESQCLGTPILGARIGSIPYVVNEGKSGMTFESGNADDLTDKIQQMWTKDFNYETIAKNAQQRFSSETYYKKLIDIYTK